MIRFVSSALLILLAATTSASVILVPDSASTIQAAIDLAATGDTIRVAAGVYQENLVLQGKAVVLQGAAGADSTFLEPVDPDDYTLFCENTGDVSILTGFTLRNGRYSETVWIGDNAPMTVSYCVFHHNIPVIGGNLTVIKCNSPATIAFNVFYNNMGINCIMAYAPSRILNNTIDGNARGVYTDYDGRTSVALNNCITNSTDYGVAGWYDTLAYNNVWGNGEGNIPGDNGISVNPLYVDQIVHDYRLQPASPNIGRATSDIGFPGPVDSVTAIGAFQTTPVPPYAADLKIVGEDLLHVSNPVFEISWSYFDTATTVQAAYEVEVWTDSTSWPYYGLLWSTGQVFSGDSVVMYPGDSLQVSKSYRLRVRVNNGVEWGEWLERLFHLNTPPSAPALVYPLDNDTLGQKVARLWVDPVTDFEGDSTWYGYELYSDAALTQFVSAGSLYVARRETELRSDSLNGFVNDTQLWWRARAFDGYAYSAWSASRTFLLRVEPRQFVVPTDLATIEDAIRITIDGDTIAVAAGVYQENIEIIDKGIVLRGIDGRDQTIIEPLDDSLPILRRSGDNTVMTTIEGLTFRSGGYGRGVVLEKCRVVFRGNAIADCKSSQSGAGLYAHEVQGEISDNIFVDDSSGAVGGAVLLEPQTRDTLIFRSNRLSFNYAIRGAALMAGGGAGASRIQHNLFDSNIGADSAGAVAVNDYAGLLLNNTFVRNHDALRILSGHCSSYGNLYAFNAGFPILHRFWIGGRNNCFFHNGELYDGNSLDDMYEDPLFVDTAAGDFRLKLASPCINANTAYPWEPDPDGTVSDIGAFPYDLSLPISVDLIFKEYSALRMTSDHPVLDWQYFDTMATTLQAFEIEVGTERDPFVASQWQTGELPAADSAIAYAGLPLVDGQDYVYRVRLRSEMQFGDWIYYAMHTNLKPDSPIPLSPILDQVVSATAVQVRVDTVANGEGDPITYDFELYYTPTSSVPVRTSLVQSSPFSSPFDSLEVNRQYWWRARAYDGYEYGPWSELQSFRTQSGARVVTVPTEYLTTQAALDVLSSGDTVKLAPGVHGGAANRELRFYGKQIVVTSTAGAQWTTIDIGGSASSPHRLLPVNYRPALSPIFLDLTISGGYADSGGVVYNSNVRFEDCVLTDNYADFGAIAAGFNCTVDLTGCRIENNEASLEGGAFYRAGIVALNCRFIGNESPKGGVVARSSGMYSGCTFQSNNADKGACFYYAGNTKLHYCLLFDNGPGFVIRSGPITLDHCTLTRNTGAVSWVDYYWPEGIWFTNCLISDNAWSANYCELDPDNGFHPEAATATYCDIYGNKYNYSGCLSDDASRPGNISLDPLFCDADNNNFHLQAGSPCLGTGEDGTNIGAFGAGCTPTDVDDPDEGNLPKTFALSQNYPNPFNPSTQISFDLPVQCDVRLAVFNILGQQVAVLVDRTLPAGTHRAVWDGRNAGGGSVSSGVYFYRLTTEAWTQSRKMLLLK